MDTDKGKGKDTSKPRTHPADCGVSFEHPPHGFKSPRGKTLACDGSITKRL